MPTNNLGLFALTDDEVADGSVSLDVYLASNPLVIQANALRLFENRSDGKVYIADPNNSYMSILDFSSSMVSSLCNDIANKFNRFYPGRTTSDEDLHEHISDFEYVGMYSQPAETEIEWIIDADYLRDNAKMTDAGFKLARIPSDTVFNIGNIMFGIYYPIDIKINPISGNISASYNEDTPNPLKSLSSVSIPKRMYKRGRLNLISLTIPIYQFKTSTVEESITSELGFSKTYTFEDKFYAARVYNFINGNWKEMNLTLSNFNYDIDTPTAKLKVSQDLNQLSVEIPYIYFNRKDIGSKIKIIIYTSLGELEVDVADIQDNSIGFKYVNGLNDPYVSVLKNTQTVFIRSTASSVFGGSNGISFEEKKQSVLYNTDGIVPITPNDVSNFFNKFGFKSILKTDDINYREYLASKHISFNDDVPVEIVSSPVFIDMDVAEQLDSVLINDDHITILPTTIFKLEPTGQKAKLASSDEVDMIKSLVGQDLADYINNSTNNYFTYPYHLFIDKQNRYPKAVTYDMFSSSNMKYLMFESEHQQIALTIDVLTTNVSTDDEGTSTMTVRVGISKDESIVNDQLTVVLTANSISRDKLGWVGTYEGYIESSALHIYKFVIETDYMFNENNINVTNALKYTANEPTSTFIPLESEWKVSTYVNYALVPGIASDDTMQSYLPHVISSEPIIGVNRFNVKMTLGTSIDKYIDNTLTVVWQNDTYERYESDVPAVYETDVIERDVNGVPIYTVVDNEFIISYLHKKGDPVLDENNNPVYKHRAGDIVLDAFGEPTPIPVSKMNYTIQMFLVNYIYAISSRRVKKSYLYQIRRELKTVFTNLDTIYSNVLDNTTISFVPISTLGYISSNVGGASDLTDLRLTFNFVFYVNSTLLENNDALDTIRDTTVSVISKYLANNSLVALSVIDDLLHNELTDEVYSFDINGFNGTNKRTIISSDASKRFVVKTELAYEPLNDTYYHRKAVNISFVGVDQIKK